MLFGTTGPEWQADLATLFRSIWTPGSAPDTALCYVAFSSRSAMWHVGKSTSLRHRHYQARPGWIERFREHLLSTRRHTYPQAHRERYRAWAASGFAYVHMLPFAWVSPQDVFWVESLAIRLLQPPAQLQDVTSDRLRERSRHRPWPKKRHQPTLQEESRLCLAAQIAAAPRATANLRPFAYDYAGLAQMARDAWGWTRQLLDKSLYRPGHELFLATFLGEARARLSYAAVWRWSNPVERLLTLLQQARRLDKTRQQRVQAKVRRFLFSSSLLPTRVCRLRVPTSDKALLARVRAATRALVTHALRGTSARLRSYFLGLLRVVPGSAGNSSEELSDQIRWAKRFQLQFALDMDSGARAFYDQRSDVRKLPYHVSYRRRGDPLRVWTEARDTVAEWMQTVGLQQHTELWLGLCDHSLHSETRERDPTHTITGWVRDRTGEQVLATLGRDTQRRASMDLAGYWWRLYKGYIEDAEFYQHRADLTAEDVAVDRNQRVQAQPPRWLWPAKEVTPSNLPYAYHNYKGKCLRDFDHHDPDHDGHAPGLCCGKDHAHAREVVAAATDPLARKLALCGKALRLAVRRALPSGWTLWNQAELTYTLEARVRRLQYLTSGPDRCPCGKERPLPLAGIKVDAAQFFKCSSADRAVRKAERLLRRLQQTKGFRGAALHATRRAPGCLCKRPSDAPKGCRCVPFEDVLRALQFCADVKFFLVGGAVVERKHGWPMGGPVSSPCTSLDLETAISRFYTDPEVGRKIGWHVPGVAPEALVQGLLHVDDSLVLSKALCCDCLLAGVQHLWPQDVGVTLEGHGAKVPFLHVEILVANAADPCPVRAVPSAPNRAYARGEAPHPTFAKLAPFAGPALCTRRHLSEYIWCRLAAFDQVFCGGTELCAVSLAELLAEATLLRWPLSSTAAVLRTYPRVHTTDFAVLARKLGASLRRATPPPTEGPQAYQFFLERIGTCLASMWAQAGVQTEPGRIEYGAEWSKWSSVYMGVCALQSQTPSPH